MLANSAEATTLHVPAEYPTIQAGLNAAMPGDTVEVACGTYQENGIELVSGVTLRSSSGLADCVIIDGLGQGRVLQGEDISMTTVIAGVTVTGGVASGEWPEVLGGGLFCEGGSPRVTECVFSHNFGEYGAAAGFLWDCSPEFTNCVFRDNVATGQGGAVNYWGATEPTMIKCEFVSNRAAAGGAIYAAGLSHFELRECVFEANSASFGGAIYTVATFAKMSYSTFGSNSAEGDGGAIYFYDDCIPLIEHCLLQDNTAQQDGGAIFWWSSMGSISNSRILHNQAQNGGGIWIGRSNVSIENTVLWSNTAFSFGGALRSFNSSCAITASIFAFTAGGSAVGCDVGVIVTCSDIFGSTGGDWVGCIADQAGINGNFSLDPLFCDAAAGDLTLSSESPCLPGNHPDGADCGLIGALGQGCGTVSVESKSWGEIKGLYR
jgi:predicted outer membrane repeat protein